MVFRHTLLAFFIYVVICVGARGPWQEVEAAKRPAALILYPDAKAIKFDERGSAARLSYHVNSKYPATPVIDLISNKLQKDGWKPLKYNFMNPNLPSSHVTGWQEFLRGIKEPVPICVHQWLGDWKDASGNFVTYAFSYKQSKCSTLGLTDLEVNAVYTPADAARKMQRAFEKWKKDHGIK
jgi:hypothetical protein